MVQFNHLLADVSVPHSLGTLSGLGVDPGANGTLTLEKIISQIIGVLTIVAVIFFAIQIIFAGYNFISAQGDEKKYEAARQSLTNGVLGLTVVVIAVGLGSLLASLAGISNVLDLNTMLGNMGLPPL
jgi:hypothetical protein